MNIQRLAAKLGYVRAEFLSKNGEITYWEFIDEDTDEIYKEYEDGLNQWAENGRNGDIPQPPRIGIPIVFKYDGKSAIKCDNEETLEALGPTRD